MSRLYWRLLIVTGTLLGSFAAAALTVRWAVVAWPRGDELA